MCVVSSRTWSDRELRSTTLTSESKGRERKRTWTRLVKAASVCLMVVGEDSAGLRASLMSGTRMDSNVTFSGDDEPPVLRGWPGCPMMLGTRSASQHDAMYLRAY